MDELPKIATAGVPTLGETGRTLKDRLNEHWQPSSRTSEVSQHLHLKGGQQHQVSLHSVRILDREADNDRRGTRESVYIHMLHLFI